MKRFLSILAVAVTIVAACAITSCNKAKPTNPLLGEWVNESTVPYGPGTAVRTIVYTFTETGVNYAGYYDGTQSCGNGGTYVYDAPNITISFTVPVCTEEGELDLPEGNSITIDTRDFGVLVFDKKQ